MCRHALTCMLTHGIKALLLDEKELLEKRVYEVPYAQYPNVMCYVIWHTTIVSVKVSRTELLHQVEILTPHCDLSLSI